MTTRIPAPPTPKKTKRTVVIYSTKEITEAEAKHALNILNCDDSLLWEYADRCALEVFEVPL